MITIFLVTLSAIVVAVNLVAFYTAGQHWWSLATALFAAAAMGWCAAFGVASHMNKKLFRNL